MKEIDSSNAFEKGNIWQSGIIEGKKHSAKNMINDTIAPNKIPGVVGKKLR